jgi:sugar-specific transcriptional regulator TrmB
MNITKSLTNIGLNKKEAKIYIALLQLGQATAYKVSNFCGLKKPTTYVILNKLAEKGVVKKIPKTEYDTVISFEALDPDSLFNNFEAKLKSSKQALPELRALNPKQKEKAKVYYYEGLNGIKKMYENVIKTAKNKEIIGFLGHNRNISKELIEFWDYFNQERIKNNILARGVATEDKTVKRWTKNQKKYLLKVKIAPKKEFDTNVSIEIFDKFIQIISFRYLQGIVIENPDIKKAFKQVFEMVWKRY